MRIRKVKKVMFPNPHVLLVAILGVCVLAGAAHADANRRGFYAGVELGFANPADMDSRVSGINHPTQCDQLLRSEPAQAGDNVLELTDPVCQVGGVRPLLNNSLNLGIGFMGAASVGYMRDNLRVEFEYLNRSHGGETQTINVPGGNAALSGKDVEWSETTPPSEKISDFSAHQFFVNAYYDFLNTTRWTPYVGVGVGWARTSLTYENRFVRKTLNQDYPSGLPPRAAGTVSYLETDITNTHFGFQFLGGLDYALTENVSVGMKGRWARFGDISDDDVWDTIRSHEPVQADGSTPFTSRQTFENVEYWALSFGLKYYF